MVVIMTMKEIWKLITDFPDYEVSDFGRVRSLDRYWTTHKGTRVDLKGRVLKPGGRGFKNKYLGVTLRKDNKAYNRYVHRLVLESFVGPCPDGMESCHDDGNTLNNKLSNLRWDTPVNNQADRRKHGTISVNRGENSIHAILTENDVRQIRETYELGGVFIVDIAAEYDVHPSTISNIIHGKTWTHVE